MTIEQSKNELEFQIAYERIREKPNNWLDSYIRDARKQFIKGNPYQQVSKPELDLVG